MGLDYSYTQPSSSDEFDMTSLLQAEAELYQDEAVSSFYIPDVDPTEADNGMPTTCYCGGVPTVETSYTAKDLGRRYYTCHNADDGDCHIWKWWDVAVTEEMSEMQRQLRLLKDQGFECEQKLLKLQKTVCELTKKSGATNVFALGVCLLVSVFIFIGLAVMYLTGRVSKK